MGNIQVTHDSDVNNARSESAIVVNPNNPMQVVAASKKFRNIQTYDFTLAASFSTDGGQTWRDSADFALPPGATVMTDPTLAWDDVGNVYSIGLVGNNPPGWITIGIVAYKSTDGGQTWSAPNLIHSSAGDDKQWCAGDTNPASPFHGRIYAVWDDGTQMRFARTKDHGATWTGTAGHAVGNSLAGDSFAPEINVAADGTVYVVWIAGSTVKMLVSTDGGDSFAATTPAATGVTTASAALPSTDGWPHLPGGTFRLVTVPTACVSGSRVSVAWEDFREGAGRIYFAQSPDKGASWTTGSSGSPLITTPIAAGLHHFLPQMISDTAGTIGCAFYEFGPKPTTPLIDVMMAESYDGGATFQYFTVTDQPWDPVIDAPWAHGDSRVTFIGDYFGIDAAGTGFIPLWTDTRTGIQELWTSTVPERRCAFIIERSTLGQDEIDARRGQPGGPVVRDAFRVVVDGFNAAQLGLTGAGSTLAVASPAAGMNIVCTGNTPDDGGYGPEVQRFTFDYDIDFGPNDTAFNFPGPDKFLTLHTAALTASASAEIELIKQPNPFILHGDPAWLSIDLRVFTVHAGDTKFGVTMGPDAGNAPAFIQEVMARLNSGGGSAGGQSFEHDLSTDEAGSSLFVFPRDGGRNVFNFALARVRYIGQIGAANTRVFFRAFQAQTTNTAFDPATSYRRANSNPDSQPIPLPGIRNFEYITIPFFASPRVDTETTSMSQQTDPPNVQNFGPSGGGESDRFFGCWLDINQPFEKVLPLTVPFTNPDGPFGLFSFATALPIQQAILRNPHQCLVAEIAFDPVPIPFGKDAGNWDKLAQRNIAWSDLGSGRALSTFEVRPTPLPTSARNPADELMIDWGRTPKGATASIFLPGVSADEVLDLASRMYTTRHLGRSDDHTLHCSAHGITYVPIPHGIKADYAGLLSLDIPNVRPGQRFDVVIRQVTNAYASMKNPPRLLESTAKKRGAAKQRSAAARASQWRRVSGAFQLSIPVHADKKVLLQKEEKLYAVMQWIRDAIPPLNRWAAVFERYVLEIGGRVTVFGGDPGKIKPSPTGEDQKPKPCDDDDTKRPCKDDGGRGFTGKVAGLLFDHFGDFEGFILETRHGEECFYSREEEIARLSERAWKERLRITVHGEGGEHRRPVSIIVHRPPTM